MDIYRLTYKCAKQPGIAVVFQEASNAKNAMMKTLQHNPSCRDQQLLKVEVKEVDQLTAFSWWRAIDVSA